MVFSRVTKVAGTLLRCALFAGILPVLISCAPAPPLVGIDNPDVPVASVVQATQHKVFIITTRQDTEVVGALFSDLRADELGLASVAVSVPPTHQPGELSRPKRLPPDPRTEFAIVEPTVYETESGIISSMNRELRQRAPADRDVLFFVHGYNTTTSDAILRVGQFVEDTGFAGVPVLFTWASAGKLSRYVYDLNSALVARPFLIDAAAIVSQTQAREFHLFAHSMGGFLTMEALVDAKQTGQFNRTGRLRDIILASPDIDIDLFRSHMQQLDTDFDRFYALLAKDDYALRASRIVAGGVPRLGAADTATLEGLGITAIDLSEIDDSSAGSHNKFAGSPEIVQLIGEGLNASPTYAGDSRTALDQVLGDLPIQIVRGN